MIASALLLACLPLSQLGKVRIDPGPEEFLAPEHPVRARYDQFKHDFGQDQAILIALRPADPFDPAFLLHLKELHQALEDEVPFVDEVNSLINARVTRGEQDRLIVEDLFEEWPDSQAALNEVREYSLANPLYDGLLISGEHRLVMINILLSAYGSGTDIEAIGGFEGTDEFLTLENRKLLSGEERAQAIAEVERVLARLQPDGLETHLLGVPVMENEVIRTMTENMGRFTGLALLSVLVLLTLVYRRLSGVLIPPAVALVSVAAAFGGSGATGIPIQLAAQLLPSLLLAVSVGSTIHLLSIFYVEFDRSGSQAGAVRHALGHSGLPIVFASLTTASGLISFSLAEVSAFHDVGILGPFGIFIQLVLCLSLVPAILHLLPLRRKPGPAAEKGDGRLERFLVWCADISVAHPVAILLASLAITIAAGSGALHFVYIFDPMTFVPESTPVRVSTQIMNEELRGVSAIEILIDTRRENGLHEPEFLASLEKLHSQVPELTDDTNPKLIVGKVLSFVDILREIHRALNENRPEFYTVPQDRQLAAQELLLFENSGSDDIEDFVDSQFRHARFTILTPWVAPSDYGSFLPKTAQAFRDVLGKDVGVEVTGFIALSVEIQDLLRSVMISSYFLAFLIITPLMMLLIGSLRGGLVSMLPNLSPIIAAIGFMGWAGIDLNLFTIIAGAVALGIAVDDTIHVFHQFHRYFAITGDTREALRQTMRTTGRALLTTSIVLSSGFLVYTTSDLPGLIDLGLVTALAVSFAFLADAFMAPALLHLLYRSRNRPIE